MEEGYLALVLHAHLPFVQHPQGTYPLEERWLHEAITECYIPLFLVLENLVRDGIDFRLTFSVSPPLAAMLDDPALQSRYVTALERLIELSAKEEQRTRTDVALHSLSRKFRASFEQVHDTFVHRYKGNLLNAFRRFRDLGKVDLITTAATHAYLPLLSVNETAVRAQIRVGVEQHQRLFGRRPKGFWLPECGYYPGVDEFLQDEQIWFTVLETHGITRAKDRPRYGVYAPIYTPAGVAAFGRDPESSRQVWSSTEGYPGDYDYREFYRDIGHELDLDYVRPYILPDGIRVDTGIKYFRITGKGDHKEIYVPEWGEKKAETHAEHFLSERRRQLSRLANLMDRKPIIVAPFDAELFGHWWYEGPRWLNHVIRKLASGYAGIRMVTLPDYLKRFPTNQTAVPCASSWGHKGFNEVWLNADNEWIYPHLHAAADTMEELSSHQAATPLEKRALDQAARELMLAQASDWAFMISGKAMKDYATSRTQDHLLAFQRLYREIGSGTIHETSLAALEEYDNIFETIPVTEAFQTVPPRPNRKAAPLSLGGKTESERPSARTLRIAMLCPEMVPFAKTGGLADMVSSLAVALQRLGQHVTLIMPAYRAVLDSRFPLKDTGLRTTVSIAGRQEESQILTTTLGERIPVYFIRSDRYFDRNHLYSSPDGDYWDNAERFAFFCRSALELLGQIDVPDILHAHDWQTAPAIAMLKTQPERYPGLVSVRTVFTVHNLGYQGRFSSNQWNVLDLDRNLFNSQCLEFYGDINFLKGGLAFADALTTVSPTYAREIRIQEHGFGLEGIFEQRAAHLTGILNGADYDVWNPDVDLYIAERYTLDDLSGKRACKEDLQRLFGLPRDPDVPLIGTVSRLASQKGFDLLQSIVDCLLQRNIQFVLLGTGDKAFQEYFAGLSSRFAGKAGVRIAYEESLAHKIVAGADVFLMPSRYEPSGLTQLYALKYGTIPIVRTTGGLKDSIEDFDPATGKGTGFRFGPYEASALRSVIDRALTAYSNKQQWSALMRNAMSADYSWQRSALQYLALYRSLAQQ
jgi:1,4-alpha-glucan branching enzyme